MRFILGSQCFVCASLAALLYGGPANPDRGFSATSPLPDRASALEAAASEEGFSLAAQEQKPAVAEPDKAAARSDATTAVLEGHTQVDPDPVAAPADADGPLASSDGALQLAGREMSTAPAVSNANVDSSEAKVAAIDPSIKVPLVQSPSECFLSNDCVNQYLWTVYERTPKQDTVKTEESVSVSVKKKGKARNVTKTVSKFMNEDFGWKDPDAAEKAGMSTLDYVIGGMDPDFKLRIYRLLRALDDAGLEPGITSAFRDDYRQSIAAGKKAASDNSYHGGSRHGGYGHGLAADLVSVRGETRADRQASSEELWKWIDAHGAEFGIGRPYLDKDPPHVGPIDGKEYADHRGANAKRMASAANTKHDDRPGLGKNADRPGHGKHDAAMRGAHIENPPHTKRADAGANPKRPDSPANPKRVDKNQRRAGAAL